MLSISRTQYRQTRTKKSERFIPLGPLNRRININIDIRNLNKLPDNDNLRQISKYAEDNNISILRHNTACLLCNIAAIRQPKSILEIGTAIGYSGILMLLNSQAQLTTIEVNEDSANIASANFQSAGLINRVTQLIGDAYEIISKATGKYDLIFLDGPKSQYVTYLPYLIEMLNNNGVLICDNVLFRGLVIGLPSKSHPKYSICVRLRAFLELITNNSNLTTTVIDIDDGVSISVYNKIY